MKNTSEVGLEKDEEVLFSIVEEMADSMTGEQSTRHWAKDALWFDIPAFASKGVKPAKAMFDKVFGSFLSCKVDILEKQITVNGNMAIVCTIQSVNIELKNGDKKSSLVRQTDCFEKRNDEWQLIHEHASFPAGGGWDGKIITE